MFQKITSTIYYAKKGDFSFFILKKFDFYSKPSTIVFVCFEQSIRESKKKLPDV